MAGKSKAEREALERQNAAITAVFERAGFDYIAPDIIQPADIFLERSGEDIRARTFVFTDPAGAEMCLRPDLTVPACRYHLSHAENPDEEAKYCYLGPAFRFPNEHLSPQEFLQAGLEWFAAPDAAAAEARVLKLAISALEAAGLTKFRVTLGDLGLFSALLEDTPMPARWRNRLKQHFWRPHAFREVWKVSPQIAAQNAAAFRPSLTAWRRSLWPTLWRRKLKTKTCRWLAADRLMKLPRALLINPPTGQRQRSIRRRPMPSPAISTSSNAPTTLREF